MTGQGLLQKGIVEGLCPGCVRLALMGPGDGGTCRFDWLITFCWDRFPSPVIFVLFSSVVCGPLFVLLFTIFLDLDLNHDSFI